MALIDRLAGQQQEKEKLAEAFASANVATFAETNPRESACQLQTKKE